MIKFKILVIYVIGFTLFLFGYFPQIIKRQDKGEGFQNPIPNQYTYRRFIWVILDAFHIDFLNANSMPFLHEQVAKDRLMLVEALALTPTVTMPRIKALTTGEIPNFIDAVFNFGVKDHIYQNIISSLNRKHVNSNNILIGDETWIKLFPDLFNLNLSLPLSSFDVTDYIEIDNKIKQTLSQTLILNSDWNIIVAHFLGLDHAGHMFGSNHSITHAKLREMDRYFAQLLHELREFKRIVDEDILLIICGDHGMTFGGNHGGASLSEIQTGMIFASIHDNDVAHTRFPTVKMNQIDIVPTLAALFGSSIPPNNLGLINIDILNAFLLGNKNNNVAKKERKMHTDEVIRHALDANIMQLDQLLKLSTEYLDVNLKTMTNDELRKFLAGLRNYIDRTHKNEYDLIYITCGWLLMLQACIHVNGHFLSNKIIKFLTFVRFSAFALVFKNGILEFNHLFITIATIIISILYDTLPQIFKKTHKTEIDENKEFNFKWLNTAFSPTLNSQFNLVNNLNCLIIYPIISTIWRNSDCLLIFVWYIVPLAELSSSFVEEEHQIWCFVRATWLTALIGTELLKSNISFGLFQKKLFASLILTLLLAAERHWNRLGDKWINVESLSDKYATFNTAIQSLSICICVFIAYLYITMDYASNHNKYKNNKATFIKYHNFSKNKNHKTGFLEKLANSKLVSIFDVLIFIAIAIFKIKFELLDTLANPRFLNSFPFQINLIIFGLNKHILALILSYLIYFRTLFILYGQICINHPHKIYISSIFKTFRDLAIYLALFLNKPSQIPLIICFLISEHLLFIILFDKDHKNRFTNKPNENAQNLKCTYKQFNLQENILKLTAYALIFGRTAFYSCGASNKIASIDLYPISKTEALYHLPIIMLSKMLLKMGKYVNVMLLFNGLILSFSTFFGPVFWTLAGCQRITENYWKTDHKDGETGNDEKKETVKICINTYLDIAITFALNSVFMSCTSAYLQRYHLFVWTVFAPRLLFQFAHFTYFCLTYIAFSVIFKYMS